MALNRLTKEVILAGDFNVKHVSWSGGVLDARGVRLADSVGAANMLVMNLGNTPTFCWQDQTSVLDLTFTRESFTRNFHFHKVTGWRVIGDKILSDHHRINFVVCSGNPVKRNRRHFPSVPIIFKQL